MAEIPLEVVAIPLEVVVILLVVVADTRAQEAVILLAVVAYTLAEAAAILLAVVADTAAEGAVILRGVAADTRVGADFPLQLLAHCVASDARLEFPAAARESLSAARDTRRRSVGVFPEVRCEG